MRFYYCLLYFIMIFFIQSLLIAAPVVQKIYNETNFGFYIVSHDDDSECSLQNKSIIIQPMTIFSYEFLLPKDRDGLILRPVFYKDSYTGNIYWFVDQKNYKYDYDLIAQAYQAWKMKNTVKKSKNNPEVWFDSWVRQDISIKFDPVEIFGYLLDFARIRIKNAHYQQVQWVSFAKGIFSRLILDLHIKTLDRKGVIGKVVVQHGQGGICMNGVVERI